MWTEGIAVAFADMFTANVISWRLGWRMRSADCISWGSFDKVGQENPLLRPRLQYSPGHWCWCHQINTWLTAEHHRSFSISLFHVRTYSTHTHTVCAHTHTEAWLFVVRFMLMSLYKHSVPRACQACGDESAGSWWEALNLVHGQTGATLELHARWHILIFIFSNSSCLQPWNSNSWWTLADWRVGLQTGLLISEAWQKCPFTYTNYEGKIDGEASQNARCYFCLSLFPPQLRLWQSLYCWGLRL